MIIQKMRPRSRSARDGAQRLASRCLVLGMLAWPALASAELYKYALPDGDVLITTERRPDLKLLEVIGGSGDSGSSSSSSSAPSAKAARNIERAQESREAHLAKHGDKHSTSELPRAVREEAFDDLILEASAAYGVPGAFIKAVIKVESNFNPQAISRAGAQGLMQLMPSVAKNLGVRDPFDPRQNIFGGTKLLRSLIDQYEGDINLILAAYNAGGVAVNRYGGIPYPQTRHYVASVYRWYKVYAAAQDAM